MSLKILIKIIVVISITTETMIKINIIF